MLLSVLGVLLMGCSQHEVGGHTAEQVFPDPQVRALANGACEGDATEVKRLVGQGVSANARGEDGFTPLLWALTCRNQPGIRALLDAGANPNQAAGNYAPMLVAATYDDPTFLKLLLARGGDPNTAEAEGADTALQMALSVGIHHKDWRNYYILLDAGADINREYKGRTIAETATSLGQMDKAIELVERGYSHNLDRLARFADIRIIDREFPVARKQQRQLLALLKAKGVPVDAIIAKRKAQDAQNEREQRAYHESLINPKSAPDTTPTTS
ncbi:MAG: ankyrin repeat domain-containing protein [Candidatus Sphingomonas phytovorans]|nr:ankyrin repeat domain-containing protein [Sphingomonas sp.]WEJ99468.1 MAG: ankyrin repeat domain-containing protein [Sphingomonas sp.]